MRSMVEGSLEPQPLHRAARGPPPLDIEGRIGSVAALHRVLEIPRPVLQLVLLGAGETVSGITRGRVPDRIAPPPQLPRLAAGKGAVVARRADVAADIVELAADVRALLPAVADERV